MQVSYDMHGIAITSLEPTALCIREIVRFRKIAAPTETIVAQRYQALPGGWYTCLSSKSTAMASGQLASPSAPAKLPRDHER